MLRFKRRITKLDTKNVQASLLELMYTLRDTQDDTKQETDDIRRALQALEARVSALE